MIYAADLHIHSKYSRATSRDCNLVELARWAALKGIRVIATGDFTHPEWSREIREALEDAEEGLFRLRKEYLPDQDRLPDGLLPQDIRFILNVEISSIYKRDGATRKIHNLVFMPDMESMDRFNARLDSIGNIASDGRPILGLDARDLLEIALETSSESFFIPAHIWTPWFSLLGSKSGFDSIEECFGDLSSHIFALETGLSSDPEMNWRVPSLDGRTLVSNSDLHSPHKLGREANLFVGNPGYVSIREAIRSGRAAIDLKAALSALNSEWPGPSGDSEPASAAPGAASGPDGGFVGTLEFFPEEGKYHFDGHRKCAARLDPEETERLQGKCPVCGGSVTVGVMNRVLELSEREEGIQPEESAPFLRQLPLDEVTSQSIGVGVQSKAVRRYYNELLEKFGPELNVLWSVPLEEMTGKIPDVLVEGIRRARSGELSVRAGYDGEYGTVELFTSSERDHFAGQTSLVPLEGVRVRRSGTRKRASIRKKPKKAEADDADGPDFRGLNEAQENAVRILDKPVLVQAGPGTGKTRTLVHRIAHLIDAEAAVPRQITAVTFTRKSAAELQDRLLKLVGQERGEYWVGTFHQLGLRVLEHYRSRGVPCTDSVLDETEALKVFREAVTEAGLEVPSGSVSRLHAQVSLLKQNLREPDEDVDGVVRAAYGAYERKLKDLEALDLDDLLTRSVTLLSTYPSDARNFGESLCAHLLVDEFQDVNKAQYEMVRLLGNPEGNGIFAIGDPDQAIYGFRGADWRFFHSFKQDYPATSEVRLTRNYRSQAHVLMAAESILTSQGKTESLTAHLPAEDPVKIVRLPTPATEGEFVARTIDAMIGGSSFHSIDSRGISTVTDELSFRDFAVVFRLNAVGDALEESFRSSGIPYQRIRKANPREEAEALDPRAEAVTLMTIHAAKGLEFPVVFVAGCDEGVMPYLPDRRGEDSPFDREEERRLLYVAMTRAGRQLFLMHVQRRGLHGRVLPGRPSPFLEVIDRRTCEYMEPLAGSHSGRSERAVQGELFA